MKFRFKVLGYIAAFLLGLFFLVGSTSAMRPELTQSQAIDKVKTILRGNATACKLKVRSVSARRVGGLWRVTAKVVMSVSGTARAETAIWNVSERNGAVPANQLTAEISHGCP